MVLLLLLYSAAMLQSFCLLTGKPDCEHFAAKAWTQCFTIKLPMCLLQQSAHSQGLASQQTK